MTEWVGAVNCSFMTALLIATCKVFESVDRRREIVQKCFFFAVGGARD